MSLTTAPLTVPRPLATPSDLTAAGVAQITAALNALAADAVGLYLKTRNDHWHLSGPHFRDSHLMFDEQAGQLLASVDVLAERVRRLGGTTLRSTGHVLRLQRVTDDDEDFVTAPDMLVRLLAENGALAARLRDAHEACDQQRDSTTASLLDVFIDETGWRSWFLFEAMQGDCGPVNVVAPVGLGEQHVSATRTHRDVIQTLPHHGHSRRGASHSLNVRGLLRLA